MKEPLTCRTARLEQGFRPAGQSTSPAARGARAALGTGRTRSFPTLSPDEHLRFGSGDPLDLLDHSAIAPCAIIHRCRALIVHRPLAIAACQPYSLPISRKRGPRITIVPTFAYSSRDEERFEPPPLCSSSTKGRSRPPPRADALLRRTVTPRKRCAANRTEVPARADVSPALPRPAPQSPVS